MAYILGWKDVLRPIRDGYRHLFPSPDTGPTPEEREQQRRHDRWKGFTYFDTFEQIRIWTPADTITSQRANTPLLNRMPITNAKACGTAKIVLCHDYAGNYQDYEAASSIGVDSESYSCEYLQFVDTLVYFSHKLVCVPPPSWTNTLHRNGVKVLGTLLIEPQTKDNDLLLQRIKDGVSMQPADCFPIATKLALMAEHFGFDGWLINIEKSFAQTSWHPLQLNAFIKQLQCELGHEKHLLWYDALTSSNKVSYQNGLTAENMAFTKACGALFTNYCWDEDSLLKSDRLARANDIHTEDIKLGVDVWAQNRSQWTQPRTTYPVHGGGGTNTGIAVSRAAKSNFSIGVFAPAWSFEHFPEHGRALERVVWEGQPLSEDIECSCGDARIRHRSNPANSLTKHGREYASGSSPFFYTDFGRAFASHDSALSEPFFGGRSYHTQLSSQSLLPLPTSVYADSQDCSSGFVLTRSLEDRAGCPQLTIRASEEPDSTSSGPSRHASPLPLFKLDMSADRFLSCSVSLRATSLFICTHLHFYLKYNDGTEDMIACEESTEAQILLTTVGHVGTDTGRSRLVEIGLKLTDYGGEELHNPIAEVYFIRIRPSKALVRSNQITIQDVHLAKHNEADVEYRLLSWKLIIAKDCRESFPGMPWSEVTGPVSYFSVLMDGSEASRAYALNFVMSGCLTDHLAGRSVDISIVGMSFDGTEMARTTQMISI